MLNDDDEKLVTHPKEKEQLHIPTQRSQPQEGDKDEEDIASQKLKSDLFVHHFTKVKNDATTIVNVSCKHCPKSYKWSASGGYETSKTFGDGASL